jgi:CheY-like chemotaxis protein
MVDMMNMSANRIAALVIDDEPFALKLFSRQLNQLGFESVISCGWLPG